MIKLIIVTYANKHKNIYLKHEAGFENIIKQLGSFLKIYMGK